MCLNLRFSVYNAFGLSNHMLEVGQFLHISSIDILLMSETYFTSKSYLFSNDFDSILFNQPLIMLNHKNKATVVYSQNLYIQAAED